MTAFRLYPGERLLESFPDQPRSTPLVAAVFPNTYRVGMSNLGFQFLFGAVARSGRLRVERLFTDAGPALEGLRAVLFSVSYEEDIPACAAILGRLGVEPLRSRRAGGPLVIAGGPAVSANPLPVSAIADAVALGEGEETLGHIIDVLATPYPAVSTAREALAQHPHLFVPAVKGGAATIGPAAPGSFAHSCVLAEETVFRGAFLIEISRGCPGACRFCLATQMYRPYRAVPLELFIETIADLPYAPRAIGLVSTAAAAHPGFSTMLRHLAGGGCRTSLSSLRAEDVNHETASALAEAGVRSLALAPESGSEPIRFRLGKRVPDDAFIEAGRLLGRSGVKHISLYLLAGIPGEGRGDEERALRFLKTFAAAAGCRITLHVNPLVPKPATPLQHMGMARESELRAAMARLRQGARKIGLAATVKGVRASLRQAQLSLGDERTGEAAVRFAAGRTSWRRALLEAGVDPASIHGERGLESPLPWERFAAAERRRSLLRRYRLFAAGDG